MKKILLSISIFLIAINNVSARENITFSRCVDGDTFKIKVNKEEKFVRMLAIDTPESVKEPNKVEYYGKESSEYTCNKLTNAKKIELEYDENSDKEDKYGRILAWVFVDDELLQKELVARGYAKVAYLYNDYKYTNTLIENQELAQSKNLGIWNDTARKEYEKEPNNDEKIENHEIVIIVVIFLIITYVTSMLNRLKKGDKK